MLKNAFFDITTIVAVVSIGNQILINQDITPNSPFKLRLFFSSMAGLLGIILMANGVHVLPGVVLDFQNLAIILSASYCGLAASIITGLIMALFQVVYYGLSFTTAISALTALIIGVGCGIAADSFKGNRQKWVYMILIILLIPSLKLVILLNNTPVLLFKSLAIYWFGTLLVTILAYYYVKYLNLSRFLYRKYQLYSCKDHRTGLNNVRQFDNELNNVAQNLTEESLVALLFIDIDSFKKINDTYGHQNGDKLLEDLGKILLSSCNCSDIVSRNGGDEFSILMTDCPRDKILGVAERIRSAVQERKFYLIDGQIINITVSIGVAIYPDTVKDISLILERADLALYEAKRSGRNRVVLDKGD